MCDEASRTSDFSFVQTDLWMLHSSWPAGERLEVQLTVDTRSSFTAFMTMPCWACDEVLLDTILGLTLKSKTQDQESSG